MDILIIKPKWVEKIFEHNKLWEIRGSSTSKRGVIGIAKSKTGCIYGTANLVGSIPLTKELWEKNNKKHQIGISWKELLTIYPKPHAWIFEPGSVKKLPEFIPFYHPRGAVIWVKSDKQFDQISNEKEQELLDR